MTPNERKILSLLQRHPEGLKPQEVLDSLHAERKERAKVLEALKGLEDQGLVRRVKGKLSLTPGSGIVRGVFSATRRGFGFVAPERGGEDIFIPARQAGPAIDGDRVEVQVKGRGRMGKPEGTIVRVIEKGRTDLLGVYKERYGMPVLAAFDVPSAEEIPLRPDAARKARPGMIVSMDRESHAVIEVLGYPDDEGVDARVVMRRRGLPAEFRPETLAEADAVPPGISEREIAGRVDYRDWPTVTIDGEKAQDFDDAVGIRPGEDGGWTLAVHIADVSHYVRPGTAVDAEARERATSVYLPGLTLPMLPESLSNDICSLRPRVNRLTVSAVLSIAADGRVCGAEFHPSVIRTVERMTYDAVFGILEGDKALRRRYARLVPDFEMMRECARALRARRERDGSLDFDLVEPELVYEEGKCLDVIAAERNEAHRIIEDFMVAANVAVATFLEGLGCPFIARVHPAPSPEDLEELGTLLAHFGLHLPPGDKATAHDLQRVLDAVHGTPEEKFVGIQVLRSMKIAAYADEDTGHYGLGQTHYCHFTSPIRRYPDLTVHRSLKGVLLREPPAPEPLAEIAEHSSERERNADAAERDLVVWRILRLLKTKLGDEFEGTITDINRAGLVIELDNYFVDGLLPFGAMGGDYFVRKNARTLKGRNLGRRYDLGDRIRVVLAACDPVLQRMEFALAEGEGAEAAGGRGAGAAPREGVFPARLAEPARGPGKARPRKGSTKRGRRPRRR